MIIFKISAVIAIILAGVLGGLFPLRKTFASGGRLALVLGNAFAGGVFLGAGLLHMMPDAISDFEGLALAIDYPVPLLLAGVGFVLILAIETLATKTATADLIAKSGRFPVILFVVLAIHSIIAGMSLGLESTLLNGVVIFVAIIAHKGSASFSLGVNMVEAGVSRQVIKRTIFFFSTMTPLGIVAGSVLSAQTSAASAQVFEVVFDALAAGTFLYIATLEIIAELFSTSPKRLATLSVLLMGFALMATIAIWT
jgi:zinc transporter 1/2/3